MIFAIKNKRFWKTLNDNKLSKVKFFGFCLLICIECFRSTEIDFYKEDIRIEIENNRATVTGEYFFKNLTNNKKRVKFFYPFPVDSLHLFPDMILLDFPYERDTNGIYFTMKMEAKRENFFKIIYCQKLQKNTFRYITTTTKMWKKPIKYAHFLIILPETLKAEVNYPIVSKYHSFKKVFYIIDKKDFCPEEDLIIKW